ncbi:MotA/TolQ/ExbB proton channel family protein [Pseudooceanicola batsensis HTCC2597]|uniref:MotA/TolQ/ExbB proton channel family protein n=1 Tax=Pseudooceanicola batsensis (strain ATCC BAA-863 / DSM 15984 / KCTC 12145 / HTCC2597) TaxID=252305 RepID=A3TYA6_PSEBH|nr:MotA/TolQ/ExbB proton channel family protein [Pseudooceanicola batsensis]EAQ03140.1 MotA/TolQ/ExbB proton channel family protein [Pseudooceanicola batsensis HTCC2597]
MPGSDLALSSPGGIVLIVLAVLSLISIALIVAKSLQLASARGGAAGRDEALVQWSKGDKEQAIAALAAGRTPADRVLHYALKATLGKMPRKPLEAELMRRGNAEVEALNRNIRILELVAMIAPLLGLLGTVLGMIQSFQELEMAQGAANASVLAGGIWQALLTTAAGLVVAIPAAVGATLLSSRVDGAAHDIEAAAGQFFLLEDTGTHAP